MSSARFAAYCAIAVGSLWCVVNAINQEPSAAALPETLRTHFKNERFEVVSSIRGLPLGVREELQTLFGSSTLDIAEPGAGGARKRRDRGSSIVDRHDNRRSRWTT